MPRLTTKPLTQKQINATRPPLSGSLTLRDADVRGLTLRIWPTTRSWSFEYRSPVTGKNARLGIGASTLVQARTIANRHRAAVVSGRDPAIEAKEDLLARQIAHSRRVTAASALDRYETAVIADAARPASRRDRIAALRRAVEPFNERPVRSLTRGDIVSRLDEIQAARGPIARNRAQAEIRHWLGWLRDRDIVETIAIDRVKKAVKEQTRDRVLDDAELSVILANAADGSAFSDILRALVHTGMRRGEAASLQPRDLDFDALTITVRGDIAKTRQARVIPMDVAIAPMLRERARGLHREGFVFGEGSDFRRPFSGWGKRVAALVAAMPPGEPWTLHDLRRTVATRLHEMGVDTLTIEDLLGHLTGVRSGVAGIYNRAATLPRQREALSAWSAKLASLILPAVEGNEVVINVAALRRTRRPR
jgi:integrase